MDAFQVHTTFVNQLRTLNATQQDVQKSVSFAMRHIDNHEDLWSCIMQACHEASLNLKMNILYFIESLCEMSSSVGPEPYYVQHLARDLRALVNLLVPDSREGLLNLYGTKQVIRNWRNRRFINQDAFDVADALLERRQDWSHVEQNGTPGTPIREDKYVKGDAIGRMSKQQRIDRMNEDRERQKRLREQRWILPIPPVAVQHRLASTLPATLSVNDAALDKEFDDIWETTSDWNEDDDDAINEENDLCFPGVLFRQGINRGGGDR
ncbi:hypothetical protein DACRYDRAFT_85365 [Dacryopinax primogenitus]|uniref:CID domain-containing protein n=1 Tax=Dacryopinax primogenitus (strain DJM 731) TaxID=1858805 RepID=M5FPB2_DACPD|nr:uncharacterized protein DACRYDRAFT_85365 [Dacryopinax primogenitus]EJT96943.1 hypothetical protein DACRYDRAFT_85365 [Dacryopinax primogenitus]